MPDISEQLTGFTDSLFGGTFSIILWVILGSFILLVVGIIIYYFFVYKKKFDILVKIISRRHGENKVFFDNGAILRDKRNNTDYLKLWNTKVELELPKFNIMHHTNKGDYIELVRESERGFRFLTPPKIDKEYIVRHNGKLFPLTKLKQFQIENDLTWIIERQKVNKSIINPESVLMKLLEYAPQIISMAFSFIIIWVVFRYAPELMNSMRQMMEELKGEEQVQIVGSIIPLLWNYGKSKI